MRRKALAVVGLVISLLAFAGCTPAQRNATEEAPTVRGRITLLERDGTVVVMSEQGQPKGFDASLGTTRVERNGRPATFADLRPGDDVTVWHVGRSLEIRAFGPDQAPPAGRP